MNNLVQKATINEIQAGDARQLILIKVSFAKIPVPPYPPSPGPVWAWGITVPHKP